MPRNTYDVYLCFRGEDTRHNFSDHLYTALVQAGIYTFRDDDEIERGENIEAELQKAIKESKISIIVFSKDYASSRWCLDQLVMIMELRETVGHIVLPVFYDVDPSQVRKQTGSFAEAFARYEMLFKEEMDKVQRWRDALREVASLVGMVFQMRYESQFVQNIVKEVEKILNRTVLNVALYPVGLDSRVKDINLWLQDWSTDVRIAMIYGINGIGKTTIAKTVYNLNVDRFEGSSFLANVRETIEQPKGLIRLQRQLLSDILKGKAIKIYNADEGIIKIKNTIFRRKVFLVLDDVDQLDQLNAIIGMREWFYPGSKIIITTRHERLLSSHEVCEKFKVNQMDDDESLELFCWHAFGQGHPTEGYMECSRSLIQHCGGLPLALKLLGYSLNGKSMREWKSLLGKLTANPGKMLGELSKLGNHKDPYTVLTDETTELTIQIEPDGVNYGTHQRGDGLSKKTNDSHYEIDFLTALSSSLENGNADVFYGGSMREDTSTYSNTELSLLLFPETENVTYINRRRDGWSRKVYLEWIFVIANFVLELPSVVFDQLSSVQKPQYALISMLFSLISMMLCIVELINKGRKKTVARKCTSTDTIGLACAIPQFIVTAINYSFARRNADSPIKISVWPIIFAFGLLCYKVFLWRPNRRKRDY